MLKPNDIIPYKKMTAKISIKGIKQHYTEARLVHLLEEVTPMQPIRYA